MRRAAVTKLHISGFKPVRVRFVRVFQYGQIQIFIRIYSHNYKLCVIQLILIVERVENRRKIYHVRSRRENDCVRDFVIFIPRFLIL